MEDEAKGRGQLEEVVQRLERENAYLNAQLKMELKSKVELKQQAHAALQQAQAAEGQLHKKQAELQQRCVRGPHPRAGVAIRLHSAVVLTFGWPRFQDGGAHRRKEWPRDSHRTGAASPRGGEHTQAKKTR